MKNSPLASVVRTVGLYIISLLVMNVFSVDAWAEKSPLESLEQTSASVLEEDILEEDIMFEGKKLESKRSQKELVPVWAADISLIALSLDAYPGSSFQHQYILPAPNLRVNTPYLQANGSGLKAHLFDSTRLDLGMTFSGTFPTENNDLDVREERNMRDLDPSLEVGLSLNYVVFRNEKWRLRTQFPLRKSTGLLLKDQDEVWRVQKPIDLGWVLAPRVSLTRFFKKENARYELGAQLGSRYATQQNMNFFYGVEQEFADVVGEEAFIAEAGLVNHWVNFGMTRRTENWRLSLFTEYSDLYSAKNVASPLIEVKSSWTGAILLTYTFAQSKNMIEQDVEFTE